MEAGSILPTGSVGLCVVDFRRWLLGGSGGLSK